MVGLGSGFTLAIPLLSWQESLFGFYTKTDTLASLQTRVCPSESWSNDRFGEGWGTGVL
jgi:hypothetical protein